jgi:hypothetical protein
MKRDSRAHRARGPYKFSVRSAPRQEHHADRPTMRHCDDYIDDPTSPEPLRKYLAFARAPAHGLLLPRPHPTLYADHAGVRVRVTMASRMGDVGITTNLSAECGYKQRVPVDQLSNFSELP